MGRRRSGRSDLMSSDWVEYEVFRCDCTNPEAVANEKHEQYVCNLRAVEFFGSDACECHYPARVLAECEAKRRIINLHPEAVAPEMKAGAAWASGEVLRILAVQYAGHPDYQTEWAA